MRVVFRACLALVALFSGAARGAAPSYSASGIVNSGNFAAGPFAPNSILTIFGSGLSRSTQQLASSDILAGQLPVELNFTRVYVDNFPAPLFYVSDSQINFLVPGNQALGAMKIRVATEGNSGPEVSVTVVDAAPALFTMTGGYAISTHVDNTLVSADSPAHAGEIIVVYATGLGKTAPNTGTGEFPKYAAPIVNLSTLKVSVGTRY